MTIEIRLLHGAVALVDDEDAELVAPYKWRESRGGRSVYAATTVIVPGKGPRVLHMHRLICAPGPGLFTDHINHDGLDNRRANLRACTPAQNSANWAHQPGACPYRGVNPQTRGGWIARIAVSGTRLYLGSFAEPLSAARAYDAAALKHHGDFAILNFPDLEAAA